MSQVIAIHSYRGGTGKSNITAMLGHELAKKGFKVGIMDTDLQSPGIHILFNLDTTKIKYALNDYLKGDCKIDEAAYNVSSDEITDNQGELLLIPSRMDSRDITMILRDGYDVSTLCDGFVKLSQELELDYLLIDTHPGINEETLLAITISDVLLLVLRPDEQDILGSAITLEIAKTLGIKNIIGVLNKTLDSVDVSNLKSDLGIPFKGAIPLSEDMVTLGSKGIFSAINPDHEISKTIAQVAESLIS